MAAWNERNPPSGVSTVFGESGNVTNVDYVAFDTTSPDTTHGVGSMYWNDADGTVDLILKGGTATLQLGQESIFRGVNKTGFTILDGSVVYFAGAVGDRKKIALAVNSDEAQADAVAGIVTENILNNGEGFVTTEGLVHNLNTSAFVDGDIVYLSAVAGGLTKVRPVQPAHAVEVGIVVRAHATQGMIYVRVKNGDHLSRLHDVLLTGVVNEQILSFDSATGLWKNVRGVAGKTDMTGFPVDSSGDYLCTLTYNETTRTVTITPTAATFDVYVLGTKYTFTGAQSIVHGSADINSFIYINESGVLVASASPWDLLKHAPICYVFQDVANSRRIPFEERHHAGRDLYWHRNQHSAEGTKATGSGFIASGYVLNASGDANNTFSISSGRLEDEDIRVDTEVLPDGGPYLLMQRSGASGTWLLTRTATIPFFRTGTNIQYNQNTGATWQLTTVPNNQYVNYYLFGVTALPQASITPAPSCVQQFAIVPGQALHTTAGTASAEVVGSLAWGSLPFQEIVPLYKLTFLYQSGAGGTVQLTSITRIIGSAASIIAAAQTDHGALTGLSDQDHPASSIINTPAGNIVATDVQAAINELDTEKAALAGAAFTGNISVEGISNLKGSTTIGANVTPGSASLRFVSTTGDRLRLYSKAAGSGVAMDCTDAGETTTARTIQIGASNGKLLLNTGVDDGIGTVQINGLTRVTGKIIAGDAASTQGQTIIQGFWGTSESLVNLGSMYSSAGVMLGFATKSSNAAANTFFSTYNATIARAAYVQDILGHRFFLGASQTVAVGSVLTMTEPMRLAASGALLVNTLIDNGVDKLQVSGSISATSNILVKGVASLGYGAGSGGAVTQATSKSTNVTLNTPTGVITMHNAALAANTAVTFGCFNSTVLGTDVIIASIQGNGTTTEDAYILTAFPSTSSGFITFVLRNVSGGSLSETVVINFAVVRGSSS